MGRKSRAKKQKRQSINFVEDNKRRWLETPQNWWPELSDEAQALMWGLQLELCCKVKQMQKLYGEGYYCIHPKENGFAYHWEAAVNEPDQWALMQVTDETSSSSLSSFWVKVNAGSVIPQSCYQMRFPCEVALSDTRGCF